MESEESEARVPFALARLGITRLVRRCFGTFYRHHLTKLHHTTMPHPTTKFPLPAFHRAALALQMLLQ